MALIKWFVSWLTASLVGCACSSIRLSVLHLQELGINRCVWRHERHLNKSTETHWDRLCKYYSRRRGRESLNLYTSQCEFPGTPPHGHTQGIMTFEKMCCQSPLYGTKFRCHKCISALGGIDFYVKMLIYGCSIPNNAPWLPVFSHICQPSNTCAFVQILELEHVKDTPTNYFLSENSCVSGWGLTGSRWKRLKMCNNSFKLGSEFPWVKMFCQISPEWVSIRLSDSPVWVK